MRKSDMIWYDKSSTVQIHDLCKKKRWEKLCGICKHVYGIKLTNVYFSGLKSCSKKNQERRKQ